MKFYFKKTYTLALLTTLTFGCSQEESFLNSQSVNSFSFDDNFRNVSNSITDVGLTLTIGPADTYICTNDSGFIKNGDIEAIISKPLLYDIIITYDTYVQKNNSKKTDQNVITWLQVPSIVGGGLISIKKGETRGTAIVCKSQIVPFITTDDCKDKSLQLITKKFKFVVNGITNTDLVNLNTSFSINNDDINPLIIDFRCPFVEGGGLIDIPSLP